MHALREVLELPPARPRWVRWDAADDTLGGWEVDGLCHEATPSGCLPRYAWSGILDRDDASSRSSVRLGQVLRGWLVQGFIEEAHHFVFEFARPLATA